MTIIIVIQKTASQIVIGLYSGYLEAWKFFEIAFQDFQLNYV